MQYIKNMNTMLTNRVKWHSRWSLVMCVTLMAFMVFGVFLSTGCSSKDTTTNGKDQTPSVNCPPGTASLADTCMLDTDGDGTPDSIDDDDDDDDIPDLTDIDDDGDGLIEIDTLERLHNIRYNPAGTSYKIATDGANDAGNNAGCGGIGGVAECNGYELTQDLSFDKDGDGETWSGDNSNGYTLDTDDSVSPYFVVDTAGKGGWEPVDAFNTIFEGNGHTITGLAIHRDEQSIGMFGFIETDADIRNVGLKTSLAYCIKTSNNIRVSNRVGGLVGHQKGGIITDSYATGNARGDLGNDYIGGLVGYQEGGSITASYATSALYGGDSDLLSVLQRPGKDYIGGLVGHQTGGTITDSYATGSVNKGMGDDSIGGLVGYQTGGSITGSYATGAVKGGSKADHIGGLVGRQGAGSITDSYATGSVNKGIIATSGANGGDRAGGLVGSQSGGSIAGSYATGNVEGGGAGSDSIGGLVGRQDGGIITASYATGAVTGAVTGVVSGSVAADQVGGLVGSQGGGSIAGSYATGDVTGGYGDNDQVGGLVGDSFGSIAGSYATGAVDGGDGNTDRVGGLVGSSSGSITGSYATGDVNGGDGSGDKAGGLVGEKGSSTPVPAESYGFGTVMGEETSNTYGPPPTDASNNAISAEQLTLSNAGTSWDDMNKNTLGAWDFGTNSQIPALKYADYDGGDGTSNDHTTYYCDPVEAGKMIPTPTTGTPIPIANCGELIPGQR